MSFSKLLRDKIQTYYVQRKYNGVDEISDMVEEYLQVMREKQKQSIRIWSKYMFTNLVMDINNILESTSENMVQDIEKILKFAVKIKNRKAYFTIKNGSQYNKYKLSRCIQKGLHLQIYVHSEACYEGMKMAIPDLRGLKMVNTLMTPIPDIRGLKMVNTLMIPNVSYYLSHVIFEKVNI